MGYNIYIDEIKVIQNHYETFIHRSFHVKNFSYPKRTLNKLKSRNIKVSDFVRKAISEKIKRDYAASQKKANVLQSLDEF